MSCQPQISIVIPAYNEARRIARSLETIRAYARQEGLKVEVIVVDDDSKDETVAVVERFREDWSELRVLKNPCNFGKGYGVRHGFLGARGEIVLFTDADLSAPITELPKLVNPIREGQADVTFGSRALRRELIGVHQSRFRENSGRIYNLLVQLITGLRFKDTQCGFKAFRREPMVAAFERQRIYDFGFDPEILFLAQRRGLRLQEVPVRWNHVEGTTVRFWTDSIRMIVDLLVIRWNQWTGKYR